MVVSSNEIHKNNRFTGEIAILPKLGGKTYKAINKIKELLENKDITLIILVVDTNADKKLINKEYNNILDNNKILSLSLYDFKPQHDIESLCDTIIHLKEIDIKVAESCFMNFKKFRDLNTKKVKIVLDISNTKITKDFLSILPQFIEFVSIPLENIL